MPGLDYAKHKDREPTQTVALIKERLAAIGIETEPFWTSSQFDGTWSCRVNIAGTSLGTNGKGTSEAYALASGYAELMERLQNKILTSRINADATFAAWGFYDHPDERLVTPREVVTRHDPIVNAWLGGWGSTTEEDRMALVEEFARAHYRRSDTRLAEVPFVDVTTSTIRWLPAALYGKLYGSNGMCAGNTMEECLVQGLSEVFERHVLAKVLRGEVVLPRIPREELGSWSVRALIDRIEEGNRFHVHVFDGSLGKGYPVVVTAIVDRATGTFGVECGAHPSLAVAVERTLTEAFQGRDVATFASVNRLASREDASSDDNRRSIMKNCVGLYPTSLLIGEPSWEFRPWDSDAGLDNAALLRRMVELLRAEGRTLLVRDASHLGFPSAHIIIPGMSEIVPATPENLSHIRLRRDLAQALNHFPQLSDDDQQVLLRAEGMGNVSDAMRLGHPLRRAAMPPARIYGYLHLERSEFADARRCFDEHARAMKMPGKLFWEAMACYARMRELGKGRDEALNLVDILYPAAFSRRLRRATDGGTSLLAQQFPQMTCPDCESCALGQADGCFGARDRVALDKLDAALASSTVSQDRLLRRLSAL